jgi:hypothetical protein
MEYKDKCDKIVFLTESLKKLVDRQFSVGTIEMDFTSKAMALTNEIQMALFAIENETNRMISEHVIEITQENERLKQTKERLLNIIESLEVKPADKSEKEEPVIKQIVQEEKTEPVEISEPEPETETKIIADSTIGNTTRPLNEIIEKKALADIRRSLSLNDRFRYRRELFGGSDEKMNSALERLNAFTSADESISYIKNTLGWNTEDEAAAEFIKLIEKRFS